MYKQNLLCRQQGMSRRINTDLNKGIVEIHFTLVFNDPKSTKNKEKSIQYTTINNEFIIKVIILVFSNN
uniref:Uncharacterized protein n=1 Tax=Timema cristinae TaxID=61476 RepID=A0A7R9GZQ9_TIMCR|nr:unnamed protein product [Timema cristinae]